ncbi:hypothetical protein GGS26DRAFT_200368 [Hypomontagnella submonticulosa]|nr:hypothetical protein GGS26DRAFT_200368 [Hypomontagnella submonticulosa]
MRQWRIPEAQRRQLAAEAGRIRAAATRPLQVWSPPASQPNIAPTSLGKLARFPNEIVLLILSKCSMRTLLRLERVNNAAKNFVSCLYDIDFVKDTVKGIIERAKAPYRKIMFTILKITMYQGLRRLLTTYTCEMCGKPGSFRMPKVKVLCDNCTLPKQLRDGSA